MRLLSDYGLMMAGMVLSIIPILILYFALQKYIIEGVVQQLRADNRENL